MFETSISQENCEKFNVFNEQSGQKYQVACTVDHDHDEYIITISKKHEGKSNGETVVDSSIVAQCDVYDLVMHYACEVLYDDGYPGFSSLHGKKLSKDIIYHGQGLITKYIARIFAYALQASDIACLNLITFFKDADTEERKMILNNLDALSTVYNNVYHSPSGDKKEEKLKFNKELSQMWEYFSLSLLHV